VRALPAASAPARLAIGLRRGGFRRPTLGRVVIYGALLAGSLVMLFPFLWMVGTSLKVDRALFVTPPQLLPIPFAPENYRIVLDTFPVGRFLVNSVVVATASTVLQLTTSAMAAYAFARLRFWGRDVLFVLYLATLMIPFQVTIVPLFVEMRLLGFVNSYPGLILPTVASAFGTFLLRQAFLGLPHELEEAAFIDGANHWTVFSRIVILGLANLHGRYTTAWNLVMAGATISVIPILAVYVAAQKQVIRSVALSGIKG
jgi:ABC-type glycerol-3-phosphate transport system permease component